MPVNIARGRSASKRSVEQYNSLSLEGAREKHAADIHRLLMSIFSVNHLYQRLIAHASTILEQVVSCPDPTLEGGVWLMAYRKLWLLSAHYLLSACSLLAIAIVY